ncbi:MAG TPA: 50S ribosomal protein L3 [Spirochaetota bacterium]|nr:50S ribosomal protein L3 [Spirochaetota bacterium]
MKKALFGRKIGMTQFIREDGTAVPVTACELGPCVIVQKKTVDKDGYSAFKLGFVNQKESRLTKPISDDLKKKNIAPKRYFAEVDNFDSGLEVGNEINCTIFEENEIVDVTGISKGHGFSGVIKRHGFGGGRITHGSHFHRAPGSIGAHTYPAEVWKGKKMPGRFGNKNVTVKNLQVVKILADKNIVLISGAVPGRKYSIIKVTVK